MVDLSLYKHAEILAIPRKKIKDITNKSDLKQIYKKSKIERFSNISEREEMDFFNLNVNLDSKYIEKKEVKIEEICKNEILDEDELRSLVNDYHIIIKKGFFDSNFTKNSFSKPLINMGEEEEKKLYLLNENSSSSTSFFNKRKDLEEITFDSLISNVRKISRNDKDRYISVTTNDIKLIIPKNKNNEIMINSSTNNYEDVPGFAGLAKKYFKKSKKFGMIFGMVIGSFVGLYQGGRLSGINQKLYSFFAPKLGYKVRKSKISYEDHTQILDTNRTKWEKQKNSLQKQINNYRLENKNLFVEKSKYKDKSEDLEGKLNEKNIESDNLKNENTEYKTKNQNLIKNNNELRTELDMNHQVIKEKNEAINKKYQPKLTEGQIKLAQFKYKTAEDYLVNHFSYLIKNNGQNDQLETTKNFSISYFETITNKAMYNQIFPKKSYSENIERLYERIIENGLKTTKLNPNEFIIKAKNYINNFLDHYQKNAPEIKLIKYDPSIKGVNVIIK